MPTHLEAAILRTIVYFDIFSYPLTTLEVWRNLGTGAQYGDVVHALRESEWLTERLGHQNGVWHLKERGESGGERSVRYRISKHKIDRASRFARFARLIPGVREIYACNSLGFLGSRSESDIDFFIAARPGRIWSVRFFSVLLVKMLGGRPSSKHTKDGLCLSFFAVQGADMRKAALPGGDVYFEHWLKNLVPLHVKNKHHPWPLPSFPRRGLRGGLGKIGDVFEETLRSVQLRLMPAHLKEMAGKGTSVILSDEFLKFHDHDRREYFRGEFSRRFAQVAG